MVAHFLEASVNFQNGEVLALYGVIFVALAIFAIVPYISAQNKQK